MFDNDLLKKCGIEEKNGHLKLKKPKLKSEYYKKNYFSISKGARTITPYKQMTEIDWYTKWVDIYQTLIRKYADIKKNVGLLDIGCGGGIWLKLFNELDFIIAEGIEPYEKFKKFWNLMGTNTRIYNMTLEEFLESKAKKYEVVFLGNILEHVDDPETFIKSIRDRLLKENGLILCKVPNDFNVLQHVVFKEKLVNKIYWVTKEHINYFTPVSLKKFFERLQFAVLDMITGFPVEIFILMGINYIQNPELGKIIHGLRMNFEIKMPTDTLISYYRNLLSTGMGRDIIIICRKL